LATDYIAGMTDDYAAKVYKELSGTSEVNFPFDPY